MNPITQSLLSGHSEDDVLDFISKAIPTLVPRIRNAKQSGYSTKGILDFVSKLMDSEEHPAYLSPSEIEKRNRNKNDEIAKQLLKMGITTATGALAGKALQTAIPKIAQTLGKGAVNPAVGQQAAQPVKQAIGAVSQTPQPAAVTPAPAPVASPKTDLKQLKATLDNFNLSSKIEKLAANNAPETIGALLQKQLSPEKKEQLEKQFGKSFSEITKEYADYYLQKGEEKPLSREGLNQQFNVIEQTKPSYKDQYPELFPENENKLPYEERVRLQKERSKLREQPSKPEKGSLAALPSGDVGEIQSISGHSALVNVNGKIKNVPLAELEPEPETVKNAKIVFDPAKIPEELKSAALTYVIAPSSRNDVMISFGPSGKFYRYYRKDGKPVDEDIIKKLEEGTEMPVTSGSSYMGAWNADKADSRGTVASHELRDKAQKAGTVDDPTKEYWFEELDVPFMHGFYEEFNKILKTMSKKFEGPKKPRKKKNG